MFGFFSLPGILKEQNAQFLFPCYRKVNSKPNSRDNPTIPGLDRWLQYGQWLLVSSTTVFHWSLNHLQTAFDRWILEGAGRECWLLKAQMRKKRHHFRERWETFKKNYNRSFQHRENSILTIHGDLTKGSLIQSCLLAVTNGKLHENRLCNMPVPWTFFPVIPLVKFCQPSLGLLTYPYTFFKEPKKLILAQAEVLCHPKLSGGKKVSQLYSWTAVLS